MALDMNRASNHTKNLPVKTERKHILDYDTSLNVIDQLCLTYRRSVEIPGFTTFSPPSPHSFPQLNDQYRVYLLGCSPLSHVHAHSSNVKGQKGMSGNILIENES